MNSDIIKVQYTTRTGCRVFVLEVNCNLRPISYTEDQQLAQTFGYANADTVCRHLRQLAWDSDPQGRIYFNDYADGVRPLVYGKETRS